MKIKKLSPTATLPTCAHPGWDLGYDIYASWAELVLNGETRPISTGIAIENAVEGYGYIIKDRSSMALKGFSVTGGIIDAGFSGEIKVLLFNHSGSDYVVNCGDKIAQLIPFPAWTSDPVQEVTELSDSERGDKGFGSTGR